MRLTARLNFLWAIAGLLGSPVAPTENMEPPAGVPPLPGVKLNIPGLPILLLGATVLKLNPPGAGAIRRNKTEKGS